MKLCYSTTELARMWEVSESTVKRWADAGLLKCRKTAGGHRKFDHNDVLNFQLETGLIHKNAVIEKTAIKCNGNVERLLAEQDFKALSQLYQETALAGQERAVSTLVCQAYLHGIPEVAIDEEIIRPALHRIGDLWRAGNAEVFEEHLATNATLQALADLHSLVTKNERAGRLALVGCTEGEFHNVASVMIRYLLEVEGWKVISFGTHTPLFSFADAISRFEPDMICVSATMADNIERAARDYDRLFRVASKHRVDVAMGGSAFQSPEIRARFRGARFFESLQELVTAASGRKNGNGQ